MGEGGITLKINCRACDICGEEMGSRDLQYWLREPIIKGGCPSLGMPRMDICSGCFAKICVLVEHPEMIRQFGGDEDELAGEADGAAEAGKAV